VTRPRRFVRLGLLLTATTLVAACNGGADGGDRAGRGTTTSTRPPPSSTLPRFTGDPESDFCRLIRDAGERPVLDPFEPDLPPREVELRYRALQNRFAEYAEVAPPEVDDVLDDLVGALDELREILEDHDYDFGELAASGEDVTVFDAPEFVDAGSRIAAYQSQVCRD
jgi:hypothetical protein